MPYRWSLIEVVGIPYTLEASLKLMPSSVIEFSAFSKDLAVQFLSFFLCMSFELVALSFGLYAASISIAPLAPPPPPAIGAPIALLTGPPAIGVLHPGAFDPCGPASSSSLVRRKQGPGR